MIKAVITFVLLVAVKTAARVFFKLKNEWITPEPENYAKGTKMIVILNHTSLYEPLIAGYAPYNLLWKFARHGVLPVAEKTMKRPIGLFFRLIVRHPVVVTRQRDKTWYKVLSKAVPAACFGAVSSSVAMTTVLAAMGVMEIRKIAW